MPGVTGHLPPMGLHAEAKSLRDPKKGITQFFYLRSLNAPARFLSGVKYKLMTISHLQEIPLPI